MYSFRQVQRYIGLCQEYGWKISWRGLEAFVRLERMGTSDRG